MGDVQLGAGDLLGLGTGGTDGLDADLNLYDLVTASAAAATGQNAIAIPQAGVNLGPLANVQSSLRVIEPMKQGCGRRNDPGAVASSTQALLTLSSNAADVTVPGLLGTNVSLSGTVGVAGADGRLTDVRCDPPGITVSVSDGLIEVDLRLEVTVYARVLGIRIAVARGPITIRGTKSSVGDAVINILGEDYDTGVRVGNGSSGLPALTVDTSGVRLIGLPVGVVLAPILELAHQRAGQPARPVARHRAGRPGAQQPGARPQRRRRPGPSDAEVRGAGAARLSAQPGRPVPAQRAGGQHAELVAGRVRVEPPRQLAPLRVVLAASAVLDDVGLDQVGVVPGLEPEVEVQPVLGRALRGPLGEELEEGAEARRVPQRPGRGAGHLGPAGEPRPELGVPVGVGGVERQRRDRAAAVVRRPLLHHAQGIALGVGEHHPRHVALAEVEVSGAQPEQALDLLGLTSAPCEVQVEPWWSTRTAARGRAGSTGRAPGRPRR